VADLFDPGPAAPEDGALVQSWLSQIDWLDHGEPPDDFFLSVRTSAPAQPHAHCLSALRRNLGPASRIGRLLRRAEYADRPADALHLRRHWSFALPGSSPGGILSGRLARVVIGQRAGKPAWAEVIDFSTRPPGPDPDALRRAAALARRRLLAYRFAVAALTGLDRSHITAALAFPGPGRVVRFRPRPIT
jgi:hypothetical protein